MYEAMEKLLEVMLQLRSLFCLPQATLDLTGNMINFECIWTNEEAKNMYDSCEQLYMCMWRKHIEYGTRVRQDA